MEKLTLKELEQAMDLAENLCDIKGLDFKTSFLYALDIRRFNKKIKKLSDDYAEKGGFLNKKIKIRAEYGPKTENVFIEGTLGMFSTANVKGCVFYDSVMCKDNLIYSDSTSQVVLISQPKKFLPFAFHEGINGKFYPFRIKDIEVIE